MSKIATFEGKILKEGNLSIPEKIIEILKLKSGDKVKTTLEIGKFDKARFLKLFGVWKGKSEEEIDIYRAIFKARDRFERKEIKI